MIAGDLTMLDLVYCEIGDDGGQIVAAFLKHDETVLSVFLIGCSIGLRGVKAIAEALKLTVTVDYLNLNHNQFGDEGAEALMNALSFNVYTTQVTLYNTKVARVAEQTIKYLTEKRNAILIPAAARRASLYIIAARSTAADAGTLACFPREIVKMIAIEIWATRKDPIWIEALSEFERKGNLRQSAESNKHLNV